MGLNLFENHFPIDGYFKFIFKQHTSYFKKKIEANCYSIRTDLQRKNISVTTNLGFLSQSMVYNITYIARTS